MAATIDNEYWDLVSGWVRPDMDGDSIAALHPNSRKELCHRYSWTIADPATVGFVAEHANGKMIDPLAGSGYWAYLLTQLGVDVIATDLAPPNAAVNFYHRDGRVHVPVGWGSATQSVKASGAGRTLLVAWPPLNRPIGRDVLRAHPGDRVISIGCRCCCGDAAMYDALATEWAEVDSHQPVRYPGITDTVTVYERI